MLEVTFSESACGSLKVAQHYGEGKYRGGAFGFIATHKDGSGLSEPELERLRREADARARRAWEQAVPLGGRAADVFCFDLALSVGNIAREDFWENRRATLLRLWRAWDAAERCAEAERCVRGAQTALETLRERFDAGEDMRVWYSEQPDEFCGLHWLMAALSPWRDGRGNVFLVKLPAYLDEPESNCVRGFTGWGDVGPESWSRLAAGQKAVSPRLCRALAGIWRAAEEENAPLRAALNGHVRGVPESLYDGWIRREIAAAPEEFHEARLIGNVLGKHTPGIFDGWLALRIEAMVEAGELVVAQEGQEGRPYSRMLRRARKA